MNLKEWRKRLFRFSLSEPFFEGTRKIRVRGLFEHEMSNQAVGEWLMEMRREMNKRAEFRRTEKVGEEMALKI